MLWYKLVPPIAYLPVSLIGHWLVDCWQIKSIQLIRLYFKLNDTDMKAL